MPSNELCRIACMSASKLTRLFKQAEGMTPQEYARTLRMERACELLGDTDLSMAEIAARLGFARQGSFSEAFKERFGATPQERPLAPGPLTLSLFAHVPISARHRVPCTFHALSHHAGALLSRVVPDPATSARPNR